MATLLEHCASQIDSRIAGGGSMSLFSTLDNATPAYVYDAACWVTDVDMSGVAVWNTGGVNKWAGTLLDTAGRNWIIGAAHAPPTGSVRFVDPADGAITTIAIAQTVNDVGGDVCLLRLASAAPTGIKAYKLLPTNWRDYLLNYSLLPVLSTDQLKRAVVGEWLVDASASAQIFAPLSAARRAYYLQPVNGDSGSPVGTIIDGDFVLLGCWGGLGSATPAEYYRAEIEAVTGAIGTVSLAAFDLVTAPAPTAVETVAAGGIGVGANWSTGSAPNWATDYITIKHAMTNAPGVWGAPVSITVNSPYVVIAPGGKLTTSSTANIGGTGKITVYGEIDIQGGQYGLATLVASGGLLRMSSGVMSSYSELRASPGARLVMFGMDTAGLVAASAAAQLATDQAAAPADQRTAATSIGGVVGTLDVDAEIDAAFATAKVRISKAQIVRGDA